MDIVRQGRDSRAVANKILEIARAKGISLTIMQLVKLMYFAQGWALAFFGKPLTKHDVRAWQYGPVYPLVYKAYRGAGARALSEPVLNAETGDAYTSDYSDDELKLLDWVVDKYGRMHAFRLSELSHAPDGPWKKTVDDEGYFAEIPEDLLKAHFDQFVAADRAVG